MKLFGPLLLAWFIVFSVPPTGAQAPSGGSARLNSISATGSSRFSSDQIAVATGLKAGANVTRADLQGGADRLSQLGPFTKVGYRFSSEPGGVDVQYQVSDAASLPVFFDNFPWVTDDDLKAALKTSVPLFDGSAPATGTLLDDMSSAMALFLERKGVFAKISYSAAAEPLTNRQVMVFLAAGAAADVKSIEFSDPLATKDDGVRDRLADLIGKPYSRTAIELFELEQLRPLYFDRGFVRADFKVPVVTAAAASGATNNANVTVKVQIDAGASYTWGGITWTGNSALAVSDLNGLVDMKAGQAVNGTKLDALWNHVAEDYERHGFLDAKVTPSPQFDEQAHRASYNVAIIEGQQYHMGDLVLSGLSLDGERLVRAAWRIAPGAVFDQSFFDEFVDHGAREAFADIPFHYQKVGHFLDKNSATGKVNVMMDFQ